LQDVSEHRFTFSLGDLPRGEFAKLSDALSLALYGGVCSIRYGGPIPLSEVEAGVLFMTEFEWLVSTDHGPIRGPRLVDVARPGAILFGKEERAESGPVEQANNGQTDGALGPTPRRDGPDAEGLSWKAEMVRRQAAFCSKLSLAARSGDVRFMGTPVDGPWSLEPSTFGAVPQAIPAAYFSIDRDFDEDCCIHAIGPEAPEPDYDDLSEGGRYVSYRDVVVERVSFLRFLKVAYPSVLNAARAQDHLKTKEAIRVLAQALREDPDLSKAEAAKLVGWSVRSRRFENEIWPDARKAANLDARASAGRKRKSPQR
jgi:hypothetical protein